MIQDYAYYENRLNNPFTEQWEAEIFGRECPSELLTKAKNVMPKKFHYSFLDNPAMPPAWIDEFIADELFAYKELLALRIIEQGWLQEKYQQQRMFWLG